MVAVFLGIWGAVYLGVLVKGAGLGVCPPPLSRNNLSYGIHQAKRLLNWLLISRGHRSGNMFGKCFGTL